MSSGADQHVPPGPDQQQPHDGSDPSQARHDAAQAKTYRQIATKNIDRLSEINRQLPKMLGWFAIALTQLTNNPIHDADQEGQPDTLEARQATFRKYALYVGRSTEIIREELTKQINDLERYKVIPKSNPKYSPAKRQGEKGDKEVNDPERLVKNGGYGDFDVGVLNARASSGQVGGEHLLDRLKAILEELQKHSECETNGEDMVVDG